MEVTEEIISKLPKEGSVSKKFIGTKSTRIHHPRTPNEWANRFFSRFSTKKPNLNKKGQIIAEGTAGKTPSIWSH